ncbi:MAG: tetratricopeptide repeat protein, partial [Bacteroidia bacterium]|nr:tetratricopeptide repeat protein [Bacteroidia bacterium]
MKFCIFLTFLLVFFSCSLQESDFSTFERLSERVNKVPDSVLLVLEDMDTLQMSDNDKAVRWLLIAKAADKSAKPLPDIIHLECAKKYFLSQNDIINQAACYFYIGRVLYEGGKKEAALQKYIKANELLSSHSTKDYQISGLINIHIGDIHFEHDLYEDALTYGKKALLNFQQINDSLNIALTIRNIGRCHLFRQDLDSAVSFYQQSVS